MTETTRAGLLVYSVILVALTAVGVQFCLPKFLGPQLPLQIGGTVEPGYEPVQDELRKLFEEGLEQNGAAFSVYHKGKLVVNIWGGYADLDAAEPWKQDTMSIFFSTSKGMGALAVALLVDRGLLKYEDLITKYWPEFGKHGKDNVTVAMAMSHQAGVACLDETDLSMEDLMDHDKVGKAIAEQKPLWPPGTAHGYHGLTRGWIDDQLVMRVDPKKRTVGQFFKEEIADKFGLDFYIGLPKSLIYRVARPREAVLSWTAIKHMASMWYQLKMLGDKAKIANTCMQHGGFKFLSDGGIAGWRNPDILELEIPAGNGVGTAESQAKVYGILANGGKHEGQALLKPSTIAKLEECINNEDVMFGDLDLITTKFSTGGMFCSDIFTSPKGTQLYGSPGYGVQIGAADPKSKLGIGYLSSTIYQYVEQDERWKRLMNKTYECLHD